MELSRILKYILLSYVISKIDDCSTASDIVQSVNILVAIWWVALAWSKVKESTIRKYFKSAGVLDKDYDIVALPSHDVDPILEAVAQMELEGLMERAYLFFHFSNHPLEPLKFAILRCSAISLAFSGLPEKYSLNM